MNRFLNYVVAFCVFTSTLVIAVLIGNRQDKKREQFEPTVRVDGSLVTVTHGRFVFTTNITRQVFMVTNQTTIAIRLGDLKPEIQERIRKAMGNERTNE